MKRQGTALERLVGAQGELPVLLHAHNEETRALKHKMKQVDNLANRFLSSPPENPFIIFTVETYIYFFKAQDLNKKYAQKILDRDRMIIRVKEANKHLKEQSLNLSGISSPLTSKFGGKSMSDVPDNISNGDMEAEIDDLRLQLEERDKEVKVSNVKLLHIFL